MMMKLRSQLRPYVMLALVLSIHTHAPAALRLPAVISDHAVLQQNESIRIWGWADPGATVTAYITGKPVTARVPESGQWSLKLPEMKAGGPYELTVESSSGEKRVVKDLYIGEVWVCGGQSNLEWSINMKIDKGDEIAAAANHPTIRFFDIPNRAAQTPQDDVTASWQLCTPQSVRDFSAVGYLFGKKLKEELNVPIGLIGANWGGTEAEPWTSPQGMAGEPRLAHRLATWEELVAKDEKQALSPARPSVLYNGMIAPITSYRVRGVIWYQGESNVSRAWEYRIVFPNMIKSWRTAWGDRDMPFYFVQIAPFNYSTAFNKAFGVNETACAELWDSQLYAFRNVGDVGMVVIHDIGDVNDIHPRNKEGVGRRLALWALSRTYGVRGITYCGPIYDDFDVEDDSIEVTFDYEGSGLTTRDGAPPSHFEIAGADRQFYPATATIADDDAVRVRSEHVKRPVAVRMGWHETAAPNLMNKEGLPASPFRTDDWPLTTQPAGQANPPAKFRLRLP